MFFSVLKRCTEIIDQCLASLRSRFPTGVLNYLTKIEQFAVTNINANEIAGFYGNDFDIDKLILHRDMIIDICNSKKVTVTVNISEVVQFLKNSENANTIGELLPEYDKFIRLALTIPISSCTAERSFSALRRLKTFLRSTMTQNRLNDLALLHIHRNQSIDLQKVLNTFIVKTEVKRNRFYAE